MPSNITFRPAVREKLPLLIGIMGGTGSGKTFTAFRLAKGIAGAEKFAVIDTESRRALHYADQFSFDHAELGPPFRPQAYADAIKAASAYPVVILDSFSHEWAGDGGILDWQEEELDRMAGDDWKKRDACKMASWIKPKMAHKHMIQKLLQAKCHVILCFRAEEKVEMEKDSFGKWKVVPKQTLTSRDGWIPICEKNTPFELTLSILLTAARPGIPNPIKLQEQHRPFLPLDRVVSEDTGVALAAWAAGGAVEPVRKPEASISEKLQTAANALQLDTWQVEVIIEECGGDSDKALERLREKYREFHPKKDKATA